jgi:pimeloyl-ACP methyl ester carboxylesterase
VDGDGSPDLDASRIYYYGHSLGAMWGTMLLGLEPNVRSGVLIAPGGPRTTTRLNGIGGRNGYGVWLASRTPSLINAPGITQIDGVPASAPLFDEIPILPLGVPLPITLDDGQMIESRSPVTDPPAGAIAIEKFFEDVEWAMQSADAVVYARYLRKDPLPHVGPKSVLIQFARTDQSVPNFATAALIRTGELADRTVLYRHDLAYADNHALPKNPHGFAFLPFFSAVPEIPIGALDQIAHFFVSQGATIIQPKPERYFEVPVSLPLPADTDYIP